VRYDQVSESSIGIYASNMTRWTDWMRVTLGVRGDLFMASSTATILPISGYTSAFLASPKLGVVFGPFDKTEFYINAGLGYHSNDARGATITVNPKRPEQAARGRAAAGALQGAEIGVRTRLSAASMRRSPCSCSISTPSCCSSAMPAPLSPAGRANGSAWEVTSTWRPRRGQASISTLPTRWRALPDYSIGGDQIPGSPASLPRGGVTLGGDTGWFGALRLRSLGPGADLRWQRLFLVHHDPQRPRRLRLRLGHQAQPRCLQPPEHRRRARSTTITSRACRASRRPASPTGISIQSSRLPSGSPWRRPSEKASRRMQDGLNHGMA